MTQEEPQETLSGSPVEPATVFAGLADIIYEKADQTDVYAAVCVAATLMVPGCHHASLMVHRGDAYSTIAASDGIARQVDELERAVGDGPCLDAIEGEGAQIDTDLNAHSQWPALASRVVAETPVRGAMGFRLLVDRHKIGALNLFSDAPNVFDTGAAGRATVLASFASVAMTAMAHGEEASTLRQGLHSNREIGKAIGMLMVLYDVSEDEGFDILRQISQGMNIKLADVAAEVIRRRGTW